MHMPFTLHALYAPAGDQPQAIEQLTDLMPKEHILLCYWALQVPENIHHGQCGGTVAASNLVISHNKTLAAQLYAEFKAFSRKMPWNTLSLIMTITNPKRIYR